MADRHHHQTGIAFFFQTKFSVEHVGVETFNRDSVETHRGDAQQKVADVQINLFRHPLVVIFQRDAMHIGEKAATFIICRFSFRRSEAAIGFFLIDDALKPCVIHCGFCAEHDDMGCV